MEQKMGFGKKFINSIYNFKAYNVFFNQSIGKGILYLFLLCLCLGTINNIFSAFAINKGTDQLKDSVESEIRDFSLKNGKLTVDGDMPIKSVSGDTIFIIDTENDVKKSSLDNYRTGIILTEKTMTSKNDSGKISTVSYKDLGDLSLTKADITPLLSTGKNILIVAMFIFTPLGGFIGKLLSSFLIMGLGGLIINAILDKHLKYSEWVKLGMYSLTVPYILKIILSIANVDIPFFFIIYYGIALLYLFLGIKALDNTPDFNDNYDTIS